MKAFNVMLAALLSVAIALAVFELGLRLIPAFRPPVTLNQFDAQTGWSKVPGRKVTRSVAGHEIEFAINAHGLRDDADTGPGKAPGTYRVLALGDSFVLGFTVAREKTFVDRLEQHWKAEGRTIDVVNAGTEGWSTDQEAAWFLQHGSEYAPDLVLLFPYENDIFWCGEQRYTRFPKPRFEPDGTLEARTLIDPGPSGVLTRSACMRLLGLTLSKLVHIPKPGEFVVKDSDVKLAGEWAPLLKDPPAFVADCEARLGGALTALRNRCDEIGARLVVVPIPSKSAIHADEREFLGGWSEGFDGLAAERWSPDRPVDRFLELALERRILALDPRPSLRAAGANRKLYFEREVEWHLNEDGNLALAEFLHNELDRLSVLPASQQAKVPVPAFGLEPLQPERRARWPFVFAGLWIALSGLFLATYPDERDWKAPLKVGAMLAIVFALFLGSGRLVALLPHQYGPWVLGLLILGVLGFVTYKLGRRVATILELCKSFVLRGHWYLMPLLVVLLTVGSLLVVAASSPLIAPFIYTLF